MDPGGAFFCLFNELKLARQAGSILMVHARRDDRVAALIHSGGIAAVNTAYDAAVKEYLFDLYNGPFGNVFRTKYRRNDVALTPQGIKDFRSTEFYRLTTII